MTETLPILKAQGVSQSYGGTPVLRQVDVTLPPGHFTAILGPNGCGKSTLLKTLSGLMPVRSGDVTLNGASISKLSTKALARVISTLSQTNRTPDGIKLRALVAQGRYPHRTILGPWRAEDERAVQDALRLAGVADLADRTLSELSGGQRQKAWIAMTLAQEARLLLLDEPTTYLDPAHQLEVLGLLRHLCDAQLKTVVAVLHDLNQAAQFADHVLFMKGGEILAEGPVKSMMTPAHIKTVYGMDVAILEHPATGAPICVPM